VAPFTFLLDKQKSRESGRACDAHLLLDTGRRSALADASGVRT